MKSVEIKSFTVNYFTFSKNYIFKEFVGSEAMRKQEQVVVLSMREMRKVEARPHDSWHRTY